MLASLGGDLLGKPKPGFCWCLPVRQHATHENLDLGFFIGAAMAKYGFVYCLLNESMPNLYKIGCTEKAPQTRADELSKASGVPTEFHVVCYIECAAYQFVEQEIHSLFKNYRSNARREFFDVPLTEIVAALFYHEEAISWVDRMAYENTHIEAHMLKNPYKVQHGTH